FDSFTLARIRNASDDADDCTPLGCPTDPCGFYTHGLGNATDMRCSMEQASGTWTAFMATPSSCFSTSPIPFVTTTDSNAILVTNQSEMGLLAPNFCSVGTTDNSPVRAILGYIDNDNYYYAEAVTGSGDFCFTTGAGVKVYQVAGGTPTLLGE